MNNYTDIITEMSTEMLATTVLPADFMSTVDFSSTADFLSTTEFLTTDLAGSTMPAESGVRGWMMDFVVKNATVKGSFWQGFLASLSVVIVSELGDKTFFIAAIMAMKHSRIIVFSGAISALVFMTVLSAAFGWIATVVPRVYTHYISAALFAIFGLKMLRDGWKMNANEGQEELDEVQTELKRREEQGSPNPSKSGDSERPHSPQIISRDGSQASLNPRTPEARKMSRPKSLRISESPNSERQVHFSPDGLKSIDDVTYSPLSAQSAGYKSPQDGSSQTTSQNESVPSLSNVTRRISPQDAASAQVSPQVTVKEKSPHDNGQKSSQSNESGQKSPSASFRDSPEPEAGPSSPPEMREDKEEAAEMLEQGQADKRKKRNAIFKVLLQAATLTFLAEWGDRSQLATVVLATREDVFGVVVGGSLGHALCTGLAVIGGRMVAQKISVRTVTIIGGLVFLFFAVSALVMGPGE